jgi:hypothetical protein
MMVSGLNPGLLCEGLDFETSRILPSLLRKLKHCMSADFKAFTVVSKVAVGLF